MQFQIKLGTLILISGVLSACGDSKSNPVKNIQGRIENPALQSKWQQEECKTPVALKVIGASYRTEYEFSGNRVTKTEHYYSENDCSELAVSVIYDGTYKKHKEVAPDINQFDLTYDTVNVIPKSDKGAKLLSNVGFCGSKDWHVDVSVDETPASKQKLCPLASLPEQVFDIYHVQESNLYFGKDSDKKKNSPENRPNELDRNNVFKKM
jgi:hypothetical protein